VSFSVAGEDGAPTDLEFNDDGTKLFVLGASGDDVNEYTLSTAYDISSASFVHVQSVTSSTPYGFFISSDGLKLYVAGIDGIIHQHSMSSAWDTTTLTYDSVSYNATAQVGSLRDMWIKPDGTKMYLVDATGDDINEYALSTAWDVSSASYVQNFSLASQDNTPIGVYFNPDGTKFWIYGFTSDTAYEYDLSTAWDLSSASYSTVSFSAASQVAFGLGMTFSRDGAKMYVSDNTGDTIYQYSTAALAGNKQFRISIEVISGNNNEFTVTI
jgi:DNA-binding beta-propeller fold protein YncE